MHIQIINDNITPKMLHPVNAGDAGIDLYAAIDSIIGLPSFGDTTTVPSGIKVAIPEGHVGLIFPRSSTGSKGLHLANVIGVIDSGYRGEILMKIRNNNAVFIGAGLLIKPMDRIAQLIVMPIYNYTLIKFTDSLSSTQRGEKGFGSTGE